MEEQKGGDGRDPTLHISAVRGSLSYLQRPLSTYLPFNLLVGDGKL